MLEIFGGPDRDRTDDLFHAMEARSQLRHRPTCSRGCNSPIVSAGAEFVKRAGLTELNAQIGRRGAIRLALGGLRTVVPATTGTSRLRKVMGNGGRRFFSK